MLRRQDDDLGAVRGMVNALPVCLMLWTGIGAFLYHLVH